MKTKILFIAPYRGLKELALSLMEGHPHLDMIVKEADLSEAIPLVKFYEKEGIDFIISRGGTANLIKQYTPTPVIEVKVSGYDIIRALTLIKDYKMRVHMIGFPNICQGVVSIAQLMNLEIAYTTIHHEGEVKEAVRNAQQNGAQVLLGDTITVKTAQQFGLQGMMITSGRESVLDAIDQVLEMNKVIYSIQDKTSVYKSLLEIYMDALALFDSDGNLLFHNHVMSTLLGTEHTSLNGHDLHAFPEIHDYVQRLMDKQEAQNFPFEIIHIKNKRVVMSGGSFTSENKSYYYITLSPDKKQSQKGNGIQIHRNHLFPISFAQIVSNNKIMEEVLKKAKRVANTNQNIVIFGEKGTGKRFIAHSIHTESGFGKGEFVEVIINNHENQEFEKVKSLFSQLDQGTIYVKGFNYLSDAEQNAIISQQKVKPDVRLIVSFEQNQGVAKDYLLQQLHWAHIELPTLKERPEDIEELARTFISLYNTRYGKQIVGLRQEVLKELITWNWPENISEFKNLIKKLVKVTDGDYIETYHLELLQEDNQAAPKSKVDLDLSKPLVDIEKDIILHVLQEENMNQTSAAKRLGINRTTLWRKLK